ncbi:hypothetical protein GMJAKD_12285 [Candidatus Electrothrix aarhusensis]
MLKEKVPTEPLVSIIMPAYNAERYIEEAVHSVLQQTWQNWELIIVNDGSNDGTQVYLDALIDPRIKVIKQKNKGVSAARNVALDIARGEYITFLDSDDVFPAYSIECRVLYLIEHTEIDLVGGCVSLRDSVILDEFSRKVPKYSGFFLPQLLSLDSNVFSSVCYLIKKKCIGEARFEIDMSHCEDLFFWITLAANENLRYASINDCIYIYRIHNNSATRNTVGWSNGYLQLVKKIASIEAISYRKTIIMRLKIFYMLVSWAIKARTPTHAIKAITVLF